MEEQNRAMMKREFEVEKRVLSARLEDLERMVEEQRERIGVLWNLHARSGERIQEIALKTIEGSLKINSLEEWIKSGVQPEDE